MAKKATAKKELIAAIPFCHPVSGFTEPSQSLSELMFVRSITAEEYGTIAQAKVEASGAVDPNDCAVFIRLDQQENDSAAEINISILTVLYALNHARETLPASFENAFLLEQEGDRVVGLKACLSLDTTEFARLPSHAGYAVKAGFDSSALAAFVSLIRAGLKKVPRLRITLQRYYNSLMRRGLEDKIVELTIALESLISSEKTELRFRFSMLLAIAAHDDPTKRQGSMKLLQDLYDARSGVVHGSMNAGDLRKVIKKVEGKWGELDELARQVVNYFLIYVSGNDPQLFNKHLVAVALGTETRVKE